MRQQLLGLQPNSDTELQKLKCDIITFFSFARNSHTLSKHLGCEKILESYTMLVHVFMENNPDVSIPQLMEELTARQILDNSSYNP